MKQYFLFIFLFLQTSQIIAQRELLNPLVDSKEAITKGSTFHEAGNYKAAIREYLKVPASDTGYSSVLFALITSHYKDSSFVEAENYGKVAMELYPHKNTDWYSLLADVYDDTKRSDLALNAYDTILKQNPYSYLTYFNKGITLFRLTRYDEAMVCFQQCILLNPYYSSAHYYLGQLAMLKGNMVQAMLSFSMNLIVYPGNIYHKNAVSFLVTIAEMNTTATEYHQNYIAGKEDVFEDVQDILVSKIALGKEYKLKADLEDVIVRQLQVVMEKLQFNGEDHGFWMQYYVPLFKRIWDIQQFEPLVFHMFSGLDIKNIKAYNNKEKKKIEAFTNTATAYLNEISKTHELVFTNRQKAQTIYYVKDYLVQGKGSYGKNTKNEEYLTGPWEFYYENGRLKSKGSFNGESIRNGEWLSYYDNGVLQEATHYLNGKANGKSQGWNDNGLVAFLTTYADDEIEGRKTTYFYNGRLSSDVLYKSGKKNGLATIYDLNGDLQSVSNYINDQLEGAASVYHPGGNLLSLLNYRKDLPFGEFREYYENGKLKVSGSYSDGRKTGLWNSYHMDSTLEEMENYVNGELHGQSVSYYSNGKTRSQRVYKKGEVEGKIQDFDDDGILFCETVLEKGRLKDITFFDKKGAVISNTTSRKGEADISFYNPQGVKISQVNYSRDGQADGRSTTYFRNGQVASEATYKNGLLEGKKSFFFPDNKIMQEGAYKENKAHGYFVNYYINGKVSDEGWYVDDQRQGTFINYDLLGNITDKVYYLNDVLHGISEFYRATGKPDHKDHYDYGWLNKIDQYDSTGKIMTISVLQKGAGKVHFNHFNSKKYIESNYKYYKLNGVYEAVNGDGSKNILAYYKNGNVDSVYTAWHPNGKIHIQGNHVNGKKSGIWKYYYYDGQLSETTSYKDGEPNGPDVQYDETGAIDKENLYKDGELDGPTTFYGDMGQRMLVFYYKENILQGYSYEDKAGKLLQMLPLVNSAGTVDAYYKNGNKSAHMVFNEGMVTGKRILYSSNGKEQVVGQRINGLEHGSKTIFYPSGKIMHEENYYFGERHGSFSHYSENGALISELNYYLGSLHGSCRYYTAGKVAQNHSYYFGELESTKSN